MKYDKHEDNLRSYKGFNLVRTDPFGFWEIKTFDNKPIPELNERFTMVRPAIQAIEAYLAKSDKTDKADKKKR